MFFALICNDKPGHLQTRLDARPAHLAFLDKLKASGEIAFAGPFLDADGKPNGSLVVVDVADRAAADAIAAADPYAGAGLFSSVEIRPWIWVVNKPDGK